jgi:hypothetical protein
MSQCSVLAQYAAGLDWPATDMQRVTTFVKGRTEAAHDKRAAVDD